MKPRSWSDGGHIGEPTVFLVGVFLASVRLHRVSLWRKVLTWSVIESESGFRGLCESRGRLRKGGCRSCSTRLRFWGFLVGMRYTLTVFDSKYHDFGLLVLRLGLGAMFIIVHGAPKLMAGPERWEKIGANVGLDFLPQFWGFMAGFAETVGAFFLLIGLFTRYALVLLIATMVMAATFHLGRGDGLAGSSAPIELGIVFVSLFFIGAGRYSLDACFRSGRPKV